MVEKRKDVMISLAISDKAWRTYENLNKIGISETRIINACVEQVLGGDIKSVMELFKIQALIEGGA